MSAVIECAFAPSELRILANWASACLQEPLPVEPTAEQALALSILKAEAQMMAALLKQQEDAP